METPKTLAEAVIYFANPDNSLQYLAAKRWPKGLECPYCGAKEPMFLSTRRIWKCRATKCRKQFSVKVGTILNESNRKYTYVRVVFTLLDDSDQDLGRVSAGTDGPRSRMPFFTCCC